MFESDGKCKTCFGRVLRFGVFMYIRESEVSLGKLDVVSFFGRELVFVVFRFFAMKIFFWDIFFRSRFFL